MTRINRGRISFIRRPWLAATCLLGLACMVPASASAEVLGYVAGVTHARPGSCPEWRLCVYKDKNFSGTKSLRREKTNADWRLSHFENGEVMNDQASSIFNSSPYRTKRLFRNTGFGSYVLCVAPKTGVKDLGAVQWIDYVPVPNQAPWPIRHSMDNRLSSHSTHDENINNLRCDWRAQ